MGVPVPYDRLLHTPDAKTPCANPMLAIWFLSIPHCVISDFVHYDSMRPAQALRNGRTNALPTRGRDVDEKLNAYRPVFRVSPLPLRPLDGLSSIVTPRGIGSGKGSGLTGLVIMAIARV